jgi:hypothetical protein
VSKGEFMMTFIPMALIMIPLIVSTIYGLKRGKSWIRAVLTVWIFLMFVSLLIQILMMPTEVRKPEILASPVIMILILTGFATWYLYVKKSSVSYFQELKFE